MSAFDLGTPRRARRPSLTPMIDVVFLLLVFFMLAARFGTDTALVLALPGASAEQRWSGPPRLVVLDETGLRLNGTPVARADLAAALAPLMQSDSDPVVLRASPGTPLQRLVDVMDTLGAAGLTGAVLVE